MKFLLVLQHPVDDPEEFTGSGNNGYLFASPLGNLVVELGEIGVVFDVDVDALGEDPPDPFVPGFGDVALVDGVAALAGGGDKAGVGTEFMGIPEPGDVPDFRDEEKCGVGADPGDGHEELGIWVPLGQGGDVGGAVRDLFLQVFKDEEVSLDAGDSEAVEPVGALVGEDVFVGWLDPVFGKDGMDLVFQFRAEFHEICSLPDHVSEVPDVWWGEVTGGQEITPEEMGEYPGIDFIGFDFCFGDSPGFEGMSQFHGVSLVFQEVVGGMGEG